MFFEATHANYTFPLDGALSDDYLKDLDYVSTDFKKNIAGIKARYVNSAHFLGETFFDLT